MPSSKSTQSHARSSGAHNASDPRGAAGTRTDSSNISGSTVVGSFNDSSWNKLSSNAQVIQTPYPAARYGWQEIPGNSSQPEQRLRDHRRPNERGSHLPANSTGVVNSHNITNSTVRDSLNDSSVNKYSQNALAVLTPQSEHDERRAPANTNYDESEIETVRNPDDLTQLERDQHHDDYVDRDGIANSHIVTKSTVITAFNDSSVNKQSRNARAVQAPRSGASSRCYVEFIYDRYHSRVPGGATTLRTQVDILDELWEPASGFGLKID